MAEDMKNLWTLRAPITSENNSTMLTFTALTYTTSPLHKDPTEALITRDHSDLGNMQTTSAASLKKS
ncbi:hypothetical protein DPMN_039677 [Dreissena polymorpha]|uniref:Uncharacterized protein n=1 Tax=Dreissena polymorpha TaxID=45954 RepID=A0A9D4HU94_DREPO|nr:hypothetical protein DPMN_039677 [Dreissena polymorpha]